MSHIPASAMPHAKAHDDEIDGQPPQLDQAQPAAEPTTPVPPASATGTQATKAASPVDDGTTAAPTATEKPVSTDQAGASAADDRSPFAIAAMVIGGLAVVGGLVAALLPILAPSDEPKGKKRKKRKPA